MNQIVFIGYQIQAPASMTFMNTKKRVVLFFIINILEIWLWTIFMCRSILLDGLAS